MTTLVELDLIPVTDGPVRRAKNCLQCGSVLVGDRLLHCNEICRVAWLRSRNLMPSEQDKKLSGRPRWGNRTHRMRGGSQDDPEVP